MLLSRVANYLFWMGRYLERAEYASKFIHTQYHSSLDAPFKNNRMVMLNPIIEMFGIGLDYGDFRTESNIIEKAILNQENTLSVSYSFKCVRQNALGARNVLSKELWEVINRFDQFLRNYKSNDKDTGQLFVFMKKVTEHIALIRNLINSSLLHDESWSIIRLGIYLERSIQINRILMSMIVEIPKEDNSKNNSLKNYMLQTILNCFDAEDIYKRIHPGLPKPLPVVHFIISHPQFPKSINYNINKASTLATRIFGVNGGSHLSNESPVFALNKLASQLMYITESDIKNRSLEFLEINIQNIENIALTLTRDYFKLR